VLIVNIPIIVDNTGIAATQGRISCPFVIFSVVTISAIDQRQQRRFAITPVRYVALTHSNSTTAVHDTTV